MLEGHTAPRYIQDQGRIPHQGGTVIDGRPIWRRGFVSDLGCFGRPQHSHILEGRTAPRCIQAQGRILNQGGSRIDGRPNLRL